MSFFFSNCYLLFNNEIGNVSLNEKSESKRTNHIDHKLSMYSCWNLVIITDIEKDNRTENAKAYGENHFKDKRVTVVVIFKEINN